MIEVWGNWNFQFTVEFDGGHFVGAKTTHKILQSSFYWPTIFKDCFEWVKLCDQCQRMGNISTRHEMPLHGIMVVQLFDV